MSPYGIFLYGVASFLFGITGGFVIGGYCHPNALTLTLVIILAATVTATWYKHETRGLNCPEEPTQFLKGNGQ